MMLFVDSQVETFKTKHKYGILLVEDDHEFRTQIKEIIQRAFSNVEVREAACGALAVERVKSARPDFVFMDIQLPDTNGLNLTRA